MDYSEIKSEIAQLKREEKYNQALDLLAKAIETLEKEIAPSGNRVSPWPFEQSAIIYRKLKQYDNEIETVRHYLRLANTIDKRGVKLARRLSKAYQNANRNTEELQNDPLLIYHGLIIDAETTGLATNDEIIELSLLSFTFNVVTGQIKVKNSYTSLNQPSRPIPASATKINGITNEMVKGHRLDRSKVNQLIKTSDFIIAHNAPFDRRFVTPLFPESNKVTWYCSMSGINWAQKGNQSRKLSDLLLAYKISLTPQTHRALDDVQATFELLCLKADGQEPLLLELLIGNPSGTSRKIEKTSSINIEVTKKGNRFSRRQLIIAGTVMLTLICLCCLLMIIIAEIGSTEDVRGPWHFVFSQLTIL